MVGELCKKKEHEPKAYSVMPFIWSIGTIIGPCVGGYFANPDKSFPSMFSHNSIFARFPYALPNVICAVLMFISVAVGYFFLGETHPDLQPWSTEDDLANTSAETPLMPTAGATAHAAADLTHASYGTFDAVDIRRKVKWTVRADGAVETPVVQNKVLCRRVVMLVVALGIFTTHSMGYDILLPIFCQDTDTKSGTTGGLGMTIQQVGIVMGVNGVIALVMQAAVFPLLASWMGIWRLFIFVTVGHPLAYLVVPYMNYFRSAGDNWLYGALYSCLTIRNFFSILSYPILLILIKEASPSPSCLGKINGLAASTGAACRMVASPLVGYLYGIGTEIHFSGLAWWACALIALMGAAQLPWIQRNKEMTTTVRTVAPCRFMPENRDTNKVVHIRVEEIRANEEV